MAQGMCTLMCAAGRGAWARVGCRGRRRLVVWARGRRAGYEETQIWLLGDDCGVAVPRIFSEHVGDTIFSESFTAVLIFGTIL